MTMRCPGSPTSPIPLIDDVTGAVSTEYALIAASVVFAIVGLLQHIGGDVGLGLGPLMGALAATAP
ncbi:MAG: hypothetical protein ICV73_16695 [Acetobacteraceae bacterium]|nr:hypothetical protein [Acetobacteraceae bacterium]